uniref:C2 domain-containing protein n=1 Tax=Mola mola TaxID=94237 RepID=A0A3Q3X6B2_MOLML
MRHVSTPAIPCSPGKRVSQGRASLPSLTKLSLVSKSRWATGRRSTVSGDSFIYSESSHLTAGAVRSPIKQGEPSPSQYGSNSLSIPAKAAPLLHFSMLFSSACGTLMVNILGLSGGSRRRSGVFVRASLPPLCRRSLSPDHHTRSFVLQVGSVEELCTCTLRLAVYTRDFSGLREAALGVLELPCEQVDWEPDSTITYTRQIIPTKTKLKKQSVSSQDTWGHRKSSVCVPRALGQLLILLQYQTLAQRIKVMVRKAENLAKLTRIPGAPHYVVINLRQDGKVIGTKETKGASGPNPVWNAPFLFNLPRGDITQLPLVLEFIVMQGRLYTKNSILGRVLIGCGTSEAGLDHWEETCSQEQTETSRWHAIQSDAL